MTYDGKKYEPGNPRTGGFKELMEHINHNLSKHGIKIEITASDETEDENKDSSVGSTKEINE